jgi:excisionase family DNA binding protein
MAAAMEPYVTTEVVAEYLGDSRKNIQRMAREGILPAYPFSGKARKTYKFRLSEIDADFAKRRTLSTTPTANPNDSSEENHENG